jgi:hypothetical protein
MNTRRRDDPYQRPAAPGTVPGTEELHRRTAEKAYELYLRRGCAPGGELDDWLQAECLVRQEMAAPRPRTAGRSRTSPAARSLPRS